jgi:threonine synthase
MTLVKVICTNCRREYTAIDNPYRCVKCGGIYDFIEPLMFDQEKIDPSQPGIWKYRHTFNIQDGIAPVSLGEGDTPLLWVDAFGHPIALKCEQLNPTGSFKDRGSSLIVSIMRSRKVIECIEDSSGNAGASISAYAARAGLHLSVYIPESAPDVKRKQIEAYGANIISIEGTRSAVSDAIKKVADGGKVYASHAYLPHNIPGYATIAYEVFEQLGHHAPGTIIAPVGQGGLILGLSRGFDAIQSAGLINRIPILVGVQARACAPLWSLFSGGVDGLRFATDGATLAEGVRIWRPIRGDLVINAVNSSKGKFIAVDEEDILIGIEEFAHRGFHIEATSALVWSAVEQCIEDCPEPIVVILTGSGLKYRPKITQSDTGQQSF